MQQDDQSYDGAKDDWDDASTASEDASDDDADDADDSYHGDSDRDDQYVPEAEKLPYSDCTASETRTVLQLSTLLNGPQWQLSNPGGRRAARVDYRLNGFETPKEPVVAAKPIAAKKPRPKSKVRRPCKQVEEYLISLHQALVIFKVGTFTDSCRKRQWTITNHGHINPVLRL